MTTWHKAFFAGLLLATPTLAAPGPALESALKLQAVELARAQAYVEACDARVAPDADAAWARTKSMIVATLTFNGTTPATVADVKASLDTLPANTDCADQRLLVTAEHLAEDWVGRTTYNLEKLGFTIKTELPDPAIWEALQTEIITQSKREGRLLLCLSLREPLLLPGEVYRWDTEVAATATLLAERGFTYDQLLLLPRVMADNIWRPAVGDAIATLTADCDADMTWYDDWSLYIFPRIRQPVEDLLQ